MKNTQLKIGNAIKTVRAIRGLSQQDLAAKTGLDASFISRIELGKREPGLGALVVIAGCLKVKASTLLAIAECPQDKILDKLGAAQ